MESLSYNENNVSKTFQFNLASSKDRKITKLVQYFTKTYENVFKFELENIDYDAESKVYFSQLKVNIL